MKCVLSDILCINFNIVNYIVSDLSVWIFKYFNWITSDTTAWIFKYLNIFSSDLGFNFTINRLNFIRLDYLYLQMIALSSIRSNWGFALVINHQNEILSISIAWIFEYFYLISSDSVAWLLKYLHSTSSDSTARIFKYINWFSLYSTAWV